MDHSSRFSDEIPSEIFSLPFDAMHKKQLNKQSSASTKLLPPMSLETILSYDPRKISLFEDHSKHILKDLDISQLYASLYNEDLGQVIDDGPDSEDEEDSLEEDSEGEDSLEEDSEEESSDEQDSDEEDSDEDSDEADSDEADSEAEEMDLELGEYLLNRAEKESMDTPQASRTAPDHVHVHLLMMQLQDKHGFSLSAVKDIYQWAHKAVLIQPKIFSGKVPSREYMLSEYKKRMGVADEAFQFKEEIINLVPDLRPAVQHVRPFLDCVFELLTNESLLGPNSCNLSLPHETDPFQTSPSRDSEHVSELHHGTWWRQTMKMARKGHGKNSRRITCPIIIETDETHTDAQGRLPVTPVNIKVGLFNNKTRKREDASTTWFYLLDDEAEASHNQQKTLPIHKIQNLHTALRNGFKDLKLLMDQQIGVKWNLFYGGKLHKVELVFSIAFTISDTAMHNKLCCKYNSHNANIQSICRHCNIATDNLINPEAFAAAKLYQLSDFDLQLHDPETDGEYWQSVSHHPIVNALDELCHGANQRRSHLATPGECLHMHQKGAMKRAVESFEYQFRMGTKVTLDNQSLAKKQKGVSKGIENLNYLGHQVGVLLSRQSDRSKPRTKFKSPLLSTTKKCGHEHAGVILCLLIALLTDRGRQICLEERTMNENFLDNFVYIFEMVLVMEQWLRDDALPIEDVKKKKDDETSGLSQALGVYITMLGKICQRGGMGSNVIKNHLILHLPDYITRWGPPSGWDGSNLERSHKTQAKRPAQLTQRRQDTFLSQLSKRYSEMRLIKKAISFFGMDKSQWNQQDSIDGNSTSGNGAPTEMITEPICGGSKFTLGLSSQNNRPAIKWKKNPGRQGHIQSAINFVYDNVITQLPAHAPKKVQGFTEYKFFPPNQQERTILRAHPSYRSISRQQRDVWYDWALFDLEKQDFGEHFLPGQILMFIQVPFLADAVSLNGINLQPNKPHAVVRLFKDCPKADFRSQKVDSDTGDVNDYSLFLEFGDVHDHFHIIPCCCIVEPTIVVPNIPMIPPETEPQTKKSKRESKAMKELINPLGDGFFVLSPRKEWGSCFSALIQSYNAER